MKVQDAINQLEKLNPNADITFIVSGVKLTWTGMTMEDFPVKVNEVKLDTVGEIKIMLKE